MTYVSGEDSEGNVVDVPSISSHVPYAMPEDEGGDGNNDAAADRAAVATAGAGDWALWHIWNPDFWYIHGIYHVYPMYIPS